MLYAPNMLGWLIGAFVGGLTGSPHCVGMCGGFAAASSDAPIAWHLGRVGTYVALGALAGAFGSAIPGPPWLAAVVAGLMLAYFSLRLAGLAPAPKLGSSAVVRIGAKLAATPGFFGRLGLGAATGLLPCGLVWAALGIAVGTGTAAGGAMAMAAFWLGTIPLLAAFSAGFHRFSALGPRHRQALAALVFAAGVWSIAQRTPAWNADPTDPPACHHTP